MIRLCYGSIDADVLEAGVLYLRITAVSYPFLALYNAGAAIFRLADTPFALTLGARGSDVLHAGGPDRNGSAPITMDGKAVFRFAVDALPKCLHTVLDETGKTLDEVDWVVCHQANSRIIDHCVKALHADAAKFFKNMDRHGNTSAASICQTMAVGSTRCQLELFSIKRSSTFQ